MIGYDAAKKLLHLDRGKTAHQSFSKAFEARKRFEVTVQPDSGMVRLHIFFDHSIVEVFAGNGEAVMTAQVFLLMLPTTASSCSAMAAIAG